MAIDPGRLMGGMPGRRRQMAEEKRDEQSVQKPIDNSHSHSKQESQNGALGAAAISAGAVPQQPNIMNQNFTNPDSQRIASGMFQGQDLENQMAQRRSTPTPVPGGSGDQDISPLMQQQKGKTQTVQNDPKLQEGSDASYGISGYVNTEKEYKQALQEKNHPNVYNSPVKQTNYPHSSKDPVAKDHMNVYNSSTNDGEKNFLVTHSEKHGSEHINDGGVSKETKREHDSLVGVYNKRNNLKEFKLKKK